jgi:hypothetical protein
VTLNVTEVKLAAAFLVELEIALFFLVNEVLLHGTHRNDPPAAREGVHAFRF